MNKKGTLYLLPTPIGDKINLELIRDYELIIRKIGLFVVEEIRTIRRFLVSINCKDLIDASEFIIWNEHSERSEISKIIDALNSGLNVGIMSEAGMPCIADPGEEIVAAAHRNKIKVVPVVGSSSIILALAASGLNGEAFVYHGYLPVDSSKRKQALLEISTDIEKTSRTHIFIEAPYRNDKMIESIVSTSASQQVLCVAVSLQTDDEIIKVQTVEKWKSFEGSFHKRPAIFLIGKEI